MGPCHLCLARQGIVAHAALSGVSVITFAAVYSRSPNILSAQVPISSRPPRLNRPIIFFKIIGHAVITNCIKLYQLSLYLLYQTISFFCNIGHFCLEPPFFTLPSTLASSPTTAALFLHNYRNNFFSPGEPRFATPIIILIHHPGHHLSAAANLDICLS